MTSRWDAFSDQELEALEQALGDRHVIETSRPDLPNLFSEVHREIKRRVAELDDPLVGVDEVPAPLSDEEKALVAERNNFLVARGWLLDDERWTHADQASAEGVDVVEALEIQARWESAL